MALLRLAALDNAQVGEDEHAAAEEQGERRPQISLLRAVAAVGSAL